MGDELVKELKAEDAESYWNLRLEGLKNNPEAFATTYEEATSRENPIELVKNQLSNEQSFTFGALVDGELKGVATLMLSKYKKMEHKGDILGMYVSPSTRKNGIGKRLIQAIIDQGKTLHVEQLRLMVVSENKGAKAFYNTLGFETYGVEKNAIKFEEKYYDEDLMVLFLK